MPWKFRIRLTYSNVMATLAVVLALGGGAFVALAAIPDSKGVIHSCFKKTTGTLRVISTGKCKTGESPLAWNQKGRRGPRGLRGLRGIQGIQGVPGPTASRSVTNNVSIGSEFALGASDTTVVDLNSVNAGNSNNQITTSFTSRIMAVGSVELIGNSSDSQCHLLISDGTGPSNGLTAISPIAEHSIGPDTADAPVVVATTGGAVKPAGTYNVRYACAKAAGTPKASSASLTVWAAAS